MRTSRSCWLNDIPTAFLSNQPDAAGGHEWNGKLSKETYTLTMRGTGSGTFQLQTRIRGQNYDYPPAPVETGAVSTVVLSDEGPPQAIKAADGKEVNPKGLNDPGTPVTMPGHITAATGPVPAGISISSKNLKAARWTTFRKITSFPRGKGAVFIGGSKLCADGSRIALNSHKGMFAINPGGSNLVQLSDQPYGVFDIAGDGRRVAGFQNEREEPSIRSLRPRASAPWRERPR